MSITIKNLTLLGKHDFSKVVGDVLRSLKVSGAKNSSAIERDAFARGDLFRSIKVSVAKKLSAIERDAFARGDLFRSIKISGVKNLSAIV